MHDPNANSPFATAEESLIYRDRVDVAEKVSDPDGRNGPMGASHHGGQAPFPKTQELTRHGISSVLGLDIGGANLKAFHSSGNALNHSFPMWLKPNELANAIANLVASLPHCDSWAVTMTGEMADCFGDRATGVRAIVEQTMIAANGLRVSQVKFYAIPGVFLNAKEAIASCDRVASANWHVLARWVASWIECPSLLMDIGSTTTDLIPLSPHCVETQSISDFDRLVRNELVYLGIQRTPVCAIVDSLPHRGLSVPIIREKFATTDDCCLLLGWTPEDPLDRETCDSMPRTRLAASNRMARLIGLDQRSVLLDDAVAMASHAMNAATQIIHNATEFHQRHGQSQWIVSGHGNRLLSVPFGVRQVDLNARLGNDVSRVAPAFAICKWMQQTQQSTISQS